MSEDPPKQELLLKLLKMTTSSNDGEALIAIRKANELLLSASWDWDKLIAGKIKIIGDPFGPSANIPTPTNGSRYAAAPAPPPRPAAPRQPPPPPPPRAPKINSTASNRYAGWCYCCGAQVPQKAGWIFDPSKINYAAQSKSQIVCNHCNQSPYTTVTKSAVPRSKPTTPGLGDI
jgi:hypothetical protein